jgi:hypothetical protein
MDALLSVYGDGRTEHGDGLAVPALASGIALVVGGAPGGGRWPSNSDRVTCGRARGGRRACSGWRAMVGQRAARTGGRVDWRSSGRRRSTGAGSGGRASGGRTHGGCRARIGRRACGGRRAGRQVAGDGRVGRCKDGWASGLAQLRRAWRAAVVG